jgi:hypothetical protein
MPKKNSSLSQVAASRSTPNLDYNPRSLRQIFVEVNLMFLSVEKRLALLFVICLLSLSSQNAFAQDKNWRPVSPRELSMTAPTVEPDADAEAIFWEVRLDDSSQDLKRTNYVRVKIFNERGREKFSKVDIPFAKGLKVRDVAARVIKPDGSIVELKKDDIFEREIIKGDGIKIKAKSFAVPGIEPGVIIEYRYRETFEDGTAKGMRLSFQRDIPVQSLAYYYKPYNKQEPDFQSFNMRGTRFVKDKDGFYLAERTNVPSFKEEPRMPPEDQVRPWMLLQGVRLNIVDVSAFSFSVTIKDPSNPTLFWGAVGAERSALTKLMTKPNNDIKKAAEEVTASASTQEEKLKKLYEFCQTEIKNTTYDSTQAEDQRKKQSEIKLIADLLKRKTATSMQVNLLFGAMASALGYETSIAYLGDRSEMFFDPKMTSEYFLHMDGIGVKVGNEWKLYNPGARFLPHGILPWMDEDVWALLVGEKGYAWRKTPITEPDKSVAKRTGRFKLSEDGTLEGDVRIEYSGQLGYRYKVENYDDSPNKREENLKEEIKRRLSAAEVSNIVIENVTDSNKPFVHAFKIKVPNYAQKTGRRLFLQPGFFEYGKNPVFPSAIRQYDIYFHFPWSEQDNIEISLPKGFELDNADQPVDIADGQKIAALAINIGVDKEQTIIVYTRKFHFGGGGNVLFPVASYQPLKNLFDAFQKADSHTITLRQK